MWKRILLSNLKSISAVGSSCAAAESTHLSLSSTPASSSISAYSSIFSFANSAPLQGRKLLDLDFPQGPFGTKEAPALVKSSNYDMRIVGCPGEDEHDIVWFWLEKGKSFECPVCSHYF